MKMLINNATETIQSLLVLSNGFSFEEAHPHITSYWSVWFCLFQLKDSIKIEIKLACLGHASMGLKF